ncbi:hypothetical protein ACJX0J_023916, partial [Zea mays]
RFPVVDSYGRRSLNVFQSTTLSTTLETPITIYISWLAYYMQLEVVNIFVNKIQMIKGFTSHDH